MAVQVGQAPSDLATLLPMMSAAQAAADPLISSCTNSFFADRPSAWAAPILRERPSQAQSLGNAAPEVADESVANVEGEPDVQEASEAGG